MDLSRVGLRFPQLDPEDWDEVADAAVEAERLGFGSLWVPDNGRATMRTISVALAVTGRIRVGSSALDIRTHPVADVAEARVLLAETYGDRFLLGLGAGRLPAAGEPAGRARDSVARLRHYLAAMDELDPDWSTPPVLTAPARPMLEIAAAHASGVLTHLTPPAHTRWARELLGPDRTVMPVVTVLLEADPVVARAAVRARLGPSLRYPPYTNVLAGLGFTATDLDHGGSDELVDQVAAWGSPADVRRRVDEHVAAGADEVCLHVVGGRPGARPRREWRELAGLFDGGPNGVGLMARRWSNGRT